MPLSGGTAAAEVLVVDDQSAVREVLRRILEAAGHRCRTADSVAQARLALDELVPDLVLCDIDMPGESGLVLVEHLSRACPEVAILMVTAFDDPAIAEGAMDHGAFGYIVKPFERNEVLIHVAGALRRRAQMVATKATVHALEREVAVRTDELQASLRSLEQTSSDLDRSHEDMLRRLACAAEFRDPETARHLERMSRYSALLGRAAGMSSEECELLRLASPMHDVGKIGVPDEILFKEGIFTPADRVIMEQHPLLGHQLLSGSSSTLLDLAAVVALTHHERYDGSGYPEGLRGEEIPLVGRIVAVADVFDALTSRRRYKPAMTLSEARALMVDGSGSHFDPVLLELFFDRTDKIEAIKDVWAESPIAMV